MGEYTASVLWGSPSNFLSFLSSSEGTIEGLQGAETCGETHVDHTTQSHNFQHLLYAKPQEKDTIDTYPMQREP